MGLFDALKSFVGSVDREYDRRIRQASLVKHYDPTGASHHGPSLGYDTHAQRIEGEGGAVGHLQSNAGPQLQHDATAAEVVQR